MELKLKIAIGSDLAGYDLKTELCERLKEKGYTLEDVGCNSSQEGIYPTYAKAVADKILSAKCDRGILVCGTGQGMAMAANKIKGIRAALCNDNFTAVMSREHNNSNIIVFGAWTTPRDKIMEILETWLFAKYNGKHDDKLEIIDNFK